MWALKYTITFVKTCNLKMLYLFFGNEVRLDISIFNFQLHYLHTFMMQLFFILMMSTEASWFCIMIGVLELFLCLNMKITTFKLENTTIVVSLIVLSSNIHNYFFEEYFFGLVDYLLFFSPGLCLLVFSFALYFWWMGSHPWFLFTRFFFFFLLSPHHLGLFGFHLFQVTQFCSLSDFIEQRDMKREFEAIKAQRQD
jgi:hypothetical protein